MKPMTDREHFERYLGAIKKEKKVIILWQLLILIGFFAIWEVASRLHWIDPLIFSSPSKITHLLMERLGNGSFLHHIQVTLTETVLGFVIGTASGIIIAIILWSSIRIARVMDPYLVIMNAMPKVALGPIIIVAFGAGYVSIIAMGAIITVIVTALVVYGAFREVDPNYEKVLLAFGASRWQIFKEIIFPATLPTMVSSLKVNVGLSWVGIIVGEFLVSKNGLGYLIIYGFQVFDFTLVMTSLILISILAAIMYKVVEKFEKWMIRDT